MNKINFRKILRNFRINILKKINRTHSALIFTLLFLILTELIILFQGHVKNLHSDQSQILALANKIVADCANSNYHPACYDDEIPKLMDFISMEDAFKVTSSVQDQDTSYKYCHVLGHRLSAKEVDKDPSKWKDVVSRCPSGECSNGCIHGGFQEKFRSESLTTNQIEEIKPDLKTICEDRPAWHPTGLEQASCYHAMGHLVMYMTSADINQSIILCQEIALKTDKRDFTHLCYDGVFMQIYQPLEPEDFALVKGKQPSKDQVKPFCDNYSGSVKGSCLSEAWPLFREQIQTGQGMIDFCNMEETSERDRCFAGIMYILTPLLSFDQTKITNFCQELPANLKGTCFSNAAGRMLENDYRLIPDAVKLCLTADLVDINHDCYQTLIRFSTFNFKPQSSQFYQLCNSLPDSWKQKCLSP